MILMTLQNGDVFTLDNEGNVIKRENGMTFAPDGTWKILGFLPRFNGRHMIGISAALAGEPTGKGWIVDMDHGTVRMWGHPEDRRLKALERIL